VEDGIAMWCREEATVHHVVEASFESLREDRKKRKVTTNDAEASGSRKCKVATNDGEASGTREGGADV
jgi:hypothetical protein